MIYHAWVHAKATCAGVKSLQRECISWLLCKRTFTISKCYKCLHGKISQRRHRYLGQTKEHGANTQIPLIVPVHSGFGIFDRQKKSCATLQIEFIDIKKMFVIKFTSPS